MKKISFYKDPKDGAEQEEVASEGNGAGTQEEGAAAE